MKYSLILLIVLSVSGCSNTSLIFATPCDGTYYEVHTDSGTNRKYHQHGSWWHYGR